MELEITNIYYSDFDNTTHYEVVFLHNDGNRYVANIFEDGNRIYLEEGAPYFDEDGEEIEDLNLINTFNDLFRSLLASGELSNLIEQYKGNIKGNDPDNKDNTKHDKDGDGGDLLRSDTSNSNSKFNYQVIEESYDDIDNGFHTEYMTMTSNLSKQQSLVSEHSKNIWQNRLKSKTGHNKSIAL